MERLGDEGIDFSRIKWFAEEAEAYAPEMATRAKGRRKRRLAHFPRVCPAPGFNWFRNKDPGYPYLWHTPCDAAITLGMGKEMTLGLSTAKEWKGEEKE